MKVVFKFPQLGYYAASNCSTKKKQTNLNYFLWVPHILLLMELAGFIFNSLCYWLALRLGAMIAV